MRILFVTHLAPPHIGGLEAAVDDLARALHDRGHEVEQVASRWDEPDSPDGTTLSRPPGSGPVQHRVRALHAIEHLTGRPYPVPGVGLVNFMRDASRRVDVVHAHGFLFPSSAISLAVASRAARDGGRPVRVLTDHASVGAYASPALDRFESLVVGTLGQLALRSAQAVVALNPRIERQISELRPGKAIVTITNGVDHDSYRPPAAGERERIRSEWGWDERPRVLFVGRLVPRKGAEIAVEVARSMGEGAELVLVGPGSSGELPANATSLGAVAPEKVAELYRAGDIFLLPSHNEGFPMTVQEAMASGMPVVLANDPAYGPYLDGAPRGVARTERSPGPLLDALRELEFGRAVDADGRDAIAGFARERFSWEEAAAAHESLYEGLLAGRSPASPSA